MTDETPDIELEERNDDGELYEHYRITVDKGQAMLRIDKYLMEHISGASRNKIQNAAKAQCILVGGTPVKQNYRVKPLTSLPDLWYIPVSAISTAHCSTPSPSIIRARPTRKAIP